MGGFVSFLGRNLANDRLPSLWGLWTEDSCRGNGSELPFRKYPLERKGKQQGMLSGSTVHLPKESQYSRKSASAKLPPVCVLSVYKWASWKECPAHTLLWKQITEKSGCAKKGGCVDPSGTVWGRPLLFSTSCVSTIDGGLTLCFCSEWTKKWNIPNFLPNHL